MPKPMRKESKSDYQCNTCGHPLLNHTNAEGKVICPDLPPPRRAVKVDEAVAAKSFAEQVADATGATAAKEKTATAEKHFNAEPIELPSKVLRVSPADIRASQLNPRVDVDTALVESIEKSGIITPLTVRELDGTKEGADYEVISGHRRLAAAKKLGLEHVPVVVIDQVDDVRWLELNLAEQINRRDLTPLEEASAARKLVELAGYTPEQVGGKLGQSTSWVLKRLSLLTLAPEAQRALKKSEVPLTVAQGLAALPSHALQVKALEQAKHRLGQKWDTESILKEVRDNVARPLRDASWKLTDADLLPAAGACSACPHNSANNRMPGLFESGKASPSCAKPDCYSDKQSEAWKRAARKHTEAGAKLVSLTKSEELFRYGNDLRSETYVAVDAPAPQDKSKRTWRDLAEKAGGKVQVYVARDRDGKPRELYQRHAVMKVIADGLKLKWAMEPDADDVEPSDVPAKGAKRDESAEKLKQLTFEAERAVQRQIVQVAVKDIAAKGPTLLDARLSFLSYFSSYTSSDIERFLCEAMGVEKPTAKEVAAFEKSATLNQILAYAWWAVVRIEGGSADEKALAQAHGLDVEKMMAAQLATAKAEALMGKAS